jgi:hypothetical protein
MGVDVFRSIHHPGATPAPLVYGRAVLAPLAFCLLPVMIGATAAALQHQLVLPFLTWGVPTAFGAAVVWTRYQLGATSAEVRVRNHEAAVRSVHDCLSGYPAQHWEWIHEIRDGSDALVVTMGFETYRFVHTAWPTHRALRDALRDAQSAGPTTIFTQQSAFPHA